MAALEMITFPAGLLGVDPARLPIVARGEDWMALAKPAGVAFGGDALESASPDLEAALVKALTSGKRQLAELGITYVGRVHHLDAAATGALVLALSPETAAQMRNAIGSLRWEFVFDVLVQTTNRPEGEKLSCDLPLVRHGVEPRMVVSHAAGKKCATTFAPMQTLGRWTLWEARTRENRLHQIRVHAAECGLRIPGETTYGSVPRIYLSDLKPRYRPGRDDERPLHPTMCVHLRQVEMGDAAATLTTVTAPRPKSFSVLLRRLQEAASVGPRQLRF